MHVAFLQEKSLLGSFGRLCGVIQTSKMDNGLQGIRHAKSMTKFWLRAPFLPGLSKVYLVWGWDRAAWAMGQVVFLRQYGGEQAPSSVLAPKVGPLGMSPKKADGCGPDGQRGKG